MTLKSKIDFMEVCAVEYVEGRRIGEFDAELSDGNKVRLKLEVSEEPHDIIPKTYNLAFGPVDGKGKINVHARLTYRNRIRVFSTILLFIESYLRAYPGHAVGVDGSSNSRAELYYRGWQRHFVRLTAFMKMTGIKFYVRISRRGERQYDNPFDFTDIEYLTFPVAREGPPESNNMYNYFVISGKDFVFY